MPPDGVVYVPCYAGASPASGSAQAASTAATGAPSPNICMMEPEDDPDGSAIAVIAQSQDACTAIGGTVDQAGGSAASSSR